MKQDVPLFGLRKQAGALLRTGPLTLSTADPAEVSSKRSTTRHWESLLGGSGDMCKEHCVHENVSLMFDFLHCSTRALRVA